MPVTIVLRIVSPHWYCRCRYCNRDDGYATPRRRHDVCFPTRLLPPFHSIPSYVVSPPPTSSVPYRSFFTTHIALFYLHTTMLKLVVVFSYAYVLSLYLCDYFSRKLFVKFEFPHLKARYVLIFHRKEFRRKGTECFLNF